MQNPILDELIESVKMQNLHVLSVVVRKDGDIIAEHNFQEEKATLLWSVSKTFTSMAIGIAENEGYFSLNDKVVRYFTDDIKQVRVNDNLKKMTIRDLLCMSTGHATCPVAKAIMPDLMKMAARNVLCLSVEHEKALKNLEDISKLFFEEPIVFEPGTHFAYNSAAAYMLSKLISITTGYSLKEYLMPRIFEPLEIPEPQWDSDVNGISLGCSGLYLTAQELSEFGQLLINRGAWNEKQLIPEDYIEQATKYQIDTSGFNEYFKTMDYKKGYGYQMWMNSYPNSYRMEGVYGQGVVMFPYKNAVVAYVSNDPSAMMTGVLELIWNTIVDKL